MKNKTLKVIGVGLALVGLLCLASDYLFAQNTNNGPAPAGTTGGSGTVTQPVSQKALLGWPVWVDGLGADEGVLDSAGRSNLVFTGSVTVGLGSTAYGITNRPGLTLGTNASITIPVNNTNTASPNLSLTNAVSGWTELTNGAAVVLANYVPGDIVVFGLVSNASAVAITNTPTIVAQAAGSFTVATLPTSSANSNSLYWLVIKH